MKLAGLHCGMMLAVLLLAGCGPEGGGSTGTGISELSGNLSSVSGASIEPEPRSRLARWKRGLFSLVETAWAQTSALAGVEVLARAGGRQTSTTTDENGAFVFTDAPDGDLLVTFRRGACEASLSLPDTVGGSRLRLADVDFECDRARAREIRETFRGVLERREPGILLVCVDSGNGSRVRTVRAGGATVRREDGSAGAVGELRSGDEMEIAGRREGAGAPSTLDAETIDILGRDAPIRCGSGGAGGDSAAENAPGGPA